MRGRAKHTVVEVEPLIALDTQNTLRAAGADVLVVHDMATALKLAKQTDLSAAILDYRLGADDCIPLCALLRERGIALAFYTGYESIPAPWADVAILRKPAGPETLVAVVATLLQKPTGQGSVAGTLAVYSR